MLAINEDINVLVLWAYTASTPYGIYTLDLISGAIIDYIATSAGASYHYFFESNTKAVKFYSSGTASYVQNVTFSGQTPTYDTAVLIGSGSSASRSTYVLRIKNTTEYNIFYYTYNGSSYVHGHKLYDSSTKVLTTKNYFNGSISIVPIYLELTDEIVGYYYTYSSPNYTNYAIKYNRATNTWGSAVACNLPRTSLVYGVEISPYDKIGVLLLFGNSAVYYSPSDPTFVNGVVALQPTQFTGTVAAYMAKVQDNSYISYFKPSSWYMAVSYGTVAAGVLPVYTASYAVEYIFPTEATPAGGYMYVTEFLPQYVYFSSISYKADLLLYGDSDFFGDYEKPQNWSKPELSSVDTGGVVRDIDFGSGTTPETLIQFASSIDVDTSWAISSTKVYVAPDGITFSLLASLAGQITISHICDLPDSNACLIAGWETASGNNRNLRIIRVSRAGVVTNIYSVGYSTSAHPNARVTAMHADSTRLFFAVRSDNGNTKDLFTSLTNNIGVVTKLAVTHAVDNLATYGGYCYQLSGGNSVYRSQGTDKAQTLIVDGATRGETYYGIAIDYNGAALHVCGSRASDTLGIYLSVATPSTAPTITASPTVSTMNLLSVSSSPNIAGDVIFGSDHATETLLAASSTSLTPTPLSWTSGATGTSINHISLDESGDFTYAHFIGSEGSKAYLGATLTTTSPKCWTKCPSPADERLSCFVGISESGVLFRANYTSLGIKLNGWTANLKPVTDATNPVYKGIQPLALNSSTSSLYIASSGGVIGVSTDFGLTKVNAAAGSPRVNCGGAFIGGLSGNLSIICPESSSVVYASTDDWATNVQYTWGITDKMDSFGFQDVNKNAFYLVVHDTNNQNARIYKGTVSTVSTPPTVIFTESDTTLRISYLLVNGGYQFAGFSNGKIKISNDEWATNKSISSPDTTPILCINFDRGLNFVYIATANGIWYAPLDLDVTEWVWVKEPSEIGEGLYAGHLIDRDLKTGIMSGAYETIYAREY